MTNWQHFSTIPDLPHPDIPVGLPVTRIILDNVRRNWQFLASSAKTLPPMAVIKADAYGHGLAPVAKILVEAGCRTMAVGTMDEGVLLRHILSGSGGEAVTIVPLLGVLSPRDAVSAVTHNLVPIVSTAEEAAFVSQAWTGSSPLPIGIKVETGMSRLGFREYEQEQIIASLRSFANLKPSLLLSQLATADDPDRDAATTAQVERFLATYTVLRAFWPDIAVSLGNSAGFLAQDILLSSLPPHIGRPGFALYGGNPFAETSREHLGESFLPTMEVFAPVMGVYDLAPGRTVSYGCTFTAERKMRIAVVGAGYADGFSRGMSGKGQVCIRGERCPVLGRVCMQKHIVDVTHIPEASFDDVAYILGGEGPGKITPNDLARNWGTIPYETFCLLGKNRRAY